MVEHYYDVTVKWTNTSKGVLSSDSLDNEVEVATPPEFKNGIPGIWSPEHLFTAAVNSCLMTTFLAIANNSKLEFIEFKSKSAGKLEKVDGKFMMSEIVLKPEVTITHQEDFDKTMLILQKAEAACLITNSIKSKITFQPKVVFK